MFEERFIDQTANDQATTAGIKLGLAAGIASPVVLLMPERVSPDINNHSRLLEEALGQINGHRDDLSSRVIGEILGNTGRLAEHTANNPGLPRDLRNWDSSLQLTNEESMVHQQWSELRNATATIDANHQYPSVSPQALHDTAMDTAKHHGFMPEASAVKLTIAEPETLAAAERYNGPVEAFNRQMTKVQSEYDAFAHADYKARRNVVGAFLGGIAINDLLDQTFIKNRSDSLVTGVVDVLSPAVGALLHRKLGSLPMLVIPVAAHLAEKFGYETEVKPRSE